MGLGVDESSCFRGYAGGYFADSSETGSERPKYPKEAGQILFFKSPMPRDDIDVAEACSSFEAGDGIYCVVFFPCDLRDLAIGVVDPTAKNPEVLYGEEVAYKWKSGLVARLMVLRGTHGEI